MPRPCRGRAGAAPAPCRECGRAAGSGRGVRITVERAHGISAVGRRSGRHLIGRETADVTMDGDAVVGRVADGSAAPSGRRRRWKPVSSATPARHQRATAGRVKTTMTPRWTAVRPVQSGAWRIPAGGRQLGLGHRRRASPSTRPGAPDPRQQRQHRGGCPWSSRPGPGFCPACRLGTAEWWASAL